MRALQTIVNIIRKVRLNLNYYLLGELVRAEHIIGPGDDNWELVKRHQQNKRYHTIWQICLGKRTMKNPFSMSM